MIAWQAAVGHASHQRNNLLSNLTRCEESLFRKPWSMMVTTKLLLENAEDKSVGTVVRNLEKGQTCNEAVEVGSGKRKRDEP